MIETEHKDVVIVGAGMGGVSAAIWGHRLGVPCFLLEQQEQIGGQLQHIHNIIPDYPGLVCDGAEFSAQLCSQLTQLGIVPQLGGSVQDVDVKSRSIRVGGQWISCKAMVVATGLRKRHLRADGAEALMGRGLAMSFSGQREMFAGRKICLVGGGDGAFENALMMVESCPHVTIVCRGRHPRARSSFLERVQAHPAIDILLESEVVAVEGTSWVEAVRIQGPTSCERLAVEAVLVKIGMEPQVEWLKGTGVAQQHGYLQVNHAQQTSIPWIWAVGDVCTPLDPSLSVAAGQACLAMRSIERYLCSV